MRTLGVHEEDGYISSFSLAICHDTDSSVGIVTGYELDGRDFAPDRGKIFPLPHSVQTGSGAQQASYPRGTGGPFPGCKTAGA
jgi:hypothetical protein